MAWNTFKVTVTTPGLGTGMKVSLAKSRGGTAVRMGVVLNAATAKDMDWLDGDMLEVLVGDGEQHGLLRLRKNNSVGTAKVQHRQAKGEFFTVKLGVVPGFVNRSEQGRWVQFEKVESGWVEIVLPSWSDETGPRGARQMAERGILPAPALRALPRPGRDVSGGLMGDPPAGRSALAERKR